MYLRNKIPVKYEKGITWLENGSNDIYWNGNTWTEFGKNNIR